MTPENLRFSSAADETAMAGIAITHDAYKRSRRLCSRVSTLGLSSQPRGRFSFGWTVRSRTVLPRCADVAKTIPTLSCGWPPSSRRKRSQTPSGRKREARQREREASSDAMVKHWPPRCAGDRKEDRQASRR
jgi:hypothetical protein